MKAQCQSGWLVGLPSETGREEKHFLHAHGIEITASGALIGYDEDELPTWAFSSSGWFNLYYAGPSFDPELCHPSGWPKHGAPEYDETRLLTLLRQNPSVARTELELAWLATRLGSGYTDATWALTQAWFEREKARDG